MMWVLYRLDGSFICRVGSVRAARPIAVCKELLIEAGAESL